MYLERMLNYNNGENIVRITRLDISINVASTIFLQCLDQHILNQYIDVDIHLCKLQFSWIRLTTLKPCEVGVSLYLLW